MRAVSSVEYDALLNSDLSERFEMFLYHRFYCDCILVTKCVTLAVYDFEDAYYHNASHVFQKNTRENMLLDAKRVDYLTFETVIEAYDYCDKLARKTLDCEHVDSI